MTTVLKFSAQLNKKILRFSQLFQLLLIDFCQDNLIVKKVIKIWKSEFEIGETVLCAVHMIVIILIPKN